MNQEVKITVLKGVKQPKPLTARAPTLSLREHRLAFLAANNKSGFLKEDTPESKDQVESLFELFFSIRAIQTFTRSEVGQWAAQLILLLGGKESAYRGSVSRTVIYKMLGFSSRNEFEKTAIKSTQDNQRHWINPRYMAPMSEFVIEAELVESDNNTIAFYDRVEKGFDVPLSQPFRPPLPWPAVLRIVTLASEYENVDRYWINSSSMQIARYTNQFIPNSKALDLIARVLGYERWLAVIGANGQERVKVLRPIEFYKNLLDEFAHLLNEKQNDNKES